jgi:hypothetical protein
MKLLYAALSRSKETLIKFCSFHCGVI